MNRIVSANLLACVLMTVQLAAALFFGLYGEKLNPFFTSVSGLLFINQVVIIFIPVAIFAFIVCKSDKVPVSVFFRLNPLSSKNIILIVLMCIVIQPLMSVLSYLSTFFFANDVSELAMDMISQVSYGEMVFLMALLPSIFEEAAMRGAILSAYGDKLGIKSTILINGLLFGMMHLNGHQFLYAAVLGVFFAYLVYKTNSIFASVIGHFTINFSQTTLVSIISTYITSPEYSQLIEQSEADVIAEYGSIAELGGYANIIALAVVLFYVGCSFILFVYLLKKFNFLNSGISLSISTQNNAASDSSLIEEQPFNNTKNVFFTGLFYLRNCREISLTFAAAMRSFRRLLQQILVRVISLQFLSLSLAVFIFFIYMIMTGLGFQQLVFLLFVFTFFFLILFLLQFRS